MPLFINEKGNISGHWTVLDLASRVGRLTLWRCLCICGQEGVVSGADLRRGRSTKCIYCKKKIYDDPSKGAYNKLIRTYRVNAKNKGRIWALSDVLLFQLFKAACHYCGAAPRTQSVMYAYKNGKRRNVREPFIYNGIDRVDSNKDYTIDNVVSCCSVCNIAKHRMSEEAFRHWVSSVYHHWVVKCQS
jgi:hypothetical protein